VALAITPDDATLVHVPLTVAQLARVFGGLEQRQHQLRHLLPRDGRLHAPWVLAKLYDTLLAPLGSAVAAAQHLWIVPHGLLHYVPFHALYRHEGDEQHWLLDAQNGVQSLSYAPSATTLFDYCRRKPPSTRSGCLALGYNDPSLMLPLAHAEREAQRVAELLGGDSRVGADATRAALLDEAQRYRYVHLSCHGWFDPAWPLASGLRLADGVLNVADMLYALRLEADLVCLSACETGQSHQLRGDELIGFTRACLYAGTPAVLASHWVVDEVATSVLMQRFYQELLALRDQPNRNARALARAQRYLRTLPTAELRAQLSQHGLDAGAAARYLESLTERLGDAPPNACLLAHPYYWAAFFLTGI
jgi:CHAT domain-containing protein